MAEIIKVIAIGSKRIIGSSGNPARIKQNEYD